MWTQYRKTFWRMQVTILVVTAAVYFLFGRLPARAGVFFAVMELSSVIGAVWATRLKTFVDRQSKVPRRSL